MYKKASTIKELKIYNIGSNYYRKKKKEETSSCKIWKMKIWFWRKKFSNLEWKAKWTIRIVTTKSHYWHVRMKDWRIIKTKVLRKLEWTNIQCKKRWRVNIKAGRLILETKIKKKRGLQKESKICRTGWEI